MSKQIEALKLALESLEDARTFTGAWPAGAKAIAAIKEAMAEQPAQDDPDLQDKDPELVEQQGTFKIGCVNHDCDKCKAQQQEPVRLRRGDVLRCIETGELCTVWATSTTGKTLIKWGSGDFGAYTAEQIGDLFWLEPQSEELELAAEQSDNYAAFHAGYRFAVAHSPASKPLPEDYTALEQALTRLQKRYADLEGKASKPLTDAQIGAVAADIWGNVLIAPQSYQAFARAIEAAHGIKE